MNEQDLPRVSVIIPTMQRRAFLQETLHYLLRTDYPHDRVEVFIVDGGSTDGSREMVEELRAGTDLNLRWHSDKSLRVSAARNHAIRTTEAEILLFLDDDCMTRADWIRQSIQPLLRGEADIAGGTDCAPPDDPFLAQCEDVAFSSWVGSGGVRGGNGPSVTGFCPMTCNMTMRRDKMLELGGFDETMQAVEDTDFVYKARARGLKVLLVPEAMVQHRRRASLLSICHHNYIRGYGRTFLWRRYPAQKQYAFFIPAVGLLEGVTLGVLGFWWTGAWILLGIEVAGYMVLLVIAAVYGYQRTRSLAAMATVPFLIALHHFWYALGVLHAPLTGYRKLFVGRHSLIADPFGKREKQH
jgi:GT2 family glycosyltransferase